MVTFIKAGFIASFCFVLFGCANASYHVEQVKTSTTPYTIPDVPFYPQQAFYCGPTTLAEVFNYHGMSVTPEAIAPQTFIPNREGSLQLEMVSATRQSGFLAYASKGDLTTLIQLVNDDIPVIVLQNNGISWMPQWHYSVIIGFDLPKEEIVLHTGLDEKLRVNLGVFMNTWQRSNNWFLAALPPTKKAFAVDQFEYVKAAQDLLSTNQVNAGTTSLITATQIWPDYWLSYFLLGNQYFSTSPQQAKLWYEQGIKNSLEAKNEIDYLNNYAYALAESGCKEQALKTINKALTISPSNANLLQSQEELLTFSATNSCKAD